MSGADATPLLDSQGPLLEGRELPGTPLPDLDPDKMNDESGWEKTLFEVFLASGVDTSEPPQQIAVKYDLLKEENGVVWGPLELSVYQGLAEFQKKEIKEAFLASQTQLNVSGPPKIQ